MFRPDMRIMTGGEMRAGPLVLVPSGCMMQEWSKTLLDNQNDRKDPLHHSNIFSIVEAQVSDEPVLFPSNCEEKRQVFEHL